MNKIAICPYNEEWPLLFQKERNAIASAIPIKIDSIHHIGSTSIPGLSAKPIIDILLEAPNINDLDSVKDRFESMGYECMGEYGIPGRRYYRKGKLIRTHHIHAFQTGSPEAQRHIAFRDYMRAHPKIAEEYASLKRSVASACKDDIEKYCDGKANFVSKHEKLALKWWENA